MKRVLVTGAGGFIGRQALPLLRERGFDIHAVSNHPRPGAFATWHQADLLDAAQRKTLIETVRPTHVLHFAWIATPGVYWTSPLNQNWQDATLDLLALSRENGAERFIGAGSCAEYDWTSGHCDERTTPLLPLTPYGRAKADCGGAVTDAEGISTAWGRIFFLYGPFEHPRRFVPSVIGSLLKAEEARCTHGAQVRDFLHVQDTAEAFVALMESDVIGPVNIASGRPVTIREVAEKIARQLFAEHLLAFGAIAPPANDPPRLTASVHRLHEEVGWAAHLTLDAGLRDTIQWWRTHSAYTWHNVPSQEER